MAKSLWDFELISAALEKLGLPNIMNPHPDEHTHPGEEDLEWGHGIKEQHRVGKPQSKYWAVGEKARKMIPHDSLCKVFCKGKNCKYCTADSWRKEQMAVNGLYSEWVTCNIMAMARMSNRNIKKFEMIKQLQNLQIKTVINLQQPGEHAHCGFGNDESGFSYNPQTLMDADLFFYNFTIQDYGVTGMPTLLDIVKVMQFAISLGKVAVHCHAGLGRTGLIIACYLIYNNRVKTSNAVQYVRSRRPGAIQTKQQLKACQQFEEYLQPFFVIFSKIHAVSFNQFLTRQRHLLHGYEARKLKHIPKVVYVCCERLLELCDKGNALSSLRNAPEVSDLESFNDSLMDRDLSPYDQLSLAETEGSSQFSNRLLQNSYSDLQYMLLEPALSSNASSDLNAFEKVTKTMSTDQMRLHHESATSSNSAFIDDDDDDDDCIIYGQTRREYGQVQEPAEETAKITEKGGAANTEKQSVCSIYRPSEVWASEHIWQVIIKINYSTDVVERIAELKESLNKTEKAWQDLAREEDPLVISGIMFDWLDQLNEPVLRAQDVSALIENFTDPRKALLRLEKSTKHFLEYIILVISKFDIPGEMLRHIVLEFVLSYLCQKRLNLNYVYVPSRHGHFGDLRQEHATNLFQLFLNFLERETKLRDL